MKKVILIIFMISIMLSGAIVFAAEAPLKQVEFQRPLSSVISTQGEITEINEGTIRVVGTGNYKDVILHISANTYIVNAEDGTAVLAKDLKAGDFVTAYYGPALTRSLPPQGHALALVVGKTRQGSAGMYMQVGKIQDGQNGSIRVLCTNNDRLVAILPEKFTQIAEIKEGSELIVWYDIMTMSLPAQATATKVVLLPAKFDIRVNTSAGVIVANKRELVLGEFDIIKSTNGTVMLPLRVIAESLGYNIVWHDQNSAVLIEKAGRTTMLKIGSKEYRTANSTMQLNYAPEIVNDKILVPAEFFTDILKLKVEISDKEGFAL